MRTLFGDTAKSAPLADQLRPESFADVVGQEHLTGEDGPIGRMLKSHQFASIILWGPPGCGKTTIARLLSAASGYEMETVSAVASGVVELKKLFEKASIRLQDGVRTMLFVDEIHRFNRAQQDVFLPYVENGTILLVGATTENPSFELNSALLSRCRVLVLKRLGEEAMHRLLDRAEQYKNQKLQLSEEGFITLCAMADGDGRYFLNLLEELFAINSAEPLTPESLTALLQQRPPVYDKHQESHYNLISALHKSLRGSDVDAALYWLHRMLAGGEAPLYIIRRLVRFAVEDIGMADPQAVQQALAAKDAYDFLGSPEGELAIVQSVIYLATAPKSNAAYMAHKMAGKDAQQYGSLMPPMHILNAPTKLMKDIGYGKDYHYDHNEKDAFSGQNYFPDNMQRATYYHPVERGFEREIIKRLEYWNKKRAERNDH
ncbi:MAG TPA: replication-associated recombination protein A [Rickettsiales bacterium]|nr:replication-associated recombination protein A [Rickettsiales bacterium]